MVEKWSGHVGDSADRLTLERFRVFFVREGYTVWGLGFRVCLGYIGYGVSVSGSVVWFSLGQERGGSLVSVRYHVC